MTTTTLSIAGYVAQQHAIQAQQRAIQAQQERQARLDRLSALQGLLSLTPTKFEIAVAELFTFWGYTKVEHTGGGGDLAADIVCFDATGRRPLCSASAICRAISWGLRQCKRSLV